MCNSDSSWVQYSTKKPQRRKEKLFVDWHLEILFDLTVRRVIKPDTLLAARWRSPGIYPPIHPV